MGSARPLNWTIRSKKKKKKKSLVAAWIIDKNRIQSFPNDLCSLTTVVQIVPDFMLSYPSSNHVFIKWRSSLHPCLWTTLSQSLVAPVKIQNKQILTKINQVDHYCLYCAFKWADVKKKIRKWSESVCLLFTASQFSWNRGWSSFGLFQ